VFSRPFGDAVQSIAPTRSEPLALVKPDEMPCTSSLREKSENFGTGPSRSLKLTVSENGNATIPTGVGYLRAQALVKCSHIDTAEDPLLALAASTDEYVRRMALGSLAQLGLRHTERVALDLWQKAPPECPRARMMVLSALSDIGSTALGTLRVDAEGSVQSELAEFARNLRGPDKGAKS
jgi:hypothetical protein